MPKISVIAPIVPGGDFKVVDAEDVGVADGSLSDYVRNNTQNLNNKANKSDVDNAFETVNTEIAKKANKSDVNTALAEKADEATVTAALNKKANTSDVNSALSGKVSNADFNTFKARTDNPHAVTKSQVGLGNVDNTSDQNKPISKATQTALNEINSKIETNTNEIEKLNSYFTLIP